MGKLKVFLDTSILFSYFRNEKDVMKLFSKEMLEKVQYIINPIVYQELILAGDRIKEKIEFKKIEDHVKMVQIDTSKMDIDHKRVREFRNRIVHTNDVLILQTAISECDYLLTLDQFLINIGKEIKTLKVVSPNEFFKLLGVHQ
jgi:predicted nucleic acid-binding protein